MALIFGKVTAQTISLYKKVTFVPNENGDGFGYFSDVFQGNTVYSHPFIGGLNRWGALFKQSGGFLTMTQQTKDAVGNGTAMSNGHFIDAGNFFSLGNTTVWKLQIDDTVGHAIAELVA